MIARRIRRLIRLVTGLFVPEHRRHGLVGEGRLWRMKRDFQIGFLKAQGLQPRHTIVDIGCGTLRGGVPIITYLDAGNYTGVEAREHVLDEARKELAVHGLVDKRPRLVAAQHLGELHIDAKFDYVWAFSVLFHMTDELLDEAFTFVGRHLAADGTFFANVSLGDRPDGSWQGFPVRFRSIEHYRTLAEAQGLDTTDLGTLESLGHVSGIESQDQQHMLRMVRRREGGRPEAR